MKEYKVKYTGSSWGTVIIKADNKTMARKIFTGEHNSWCRIVSIEEVRTVTKLYIAYGSNLNMEQMALRCPTAKVYGKGNIKNWDLVFRGSKTGSYATIKKRKGASVPVGVWEITEADEERLDKYEGFPNFYHKEYIYVTMEDGSRKKALVYIMRADAKRGQPTQRYIDTCEQGYRDFGFDTEIFEDFVWMN